MSMGEYLAAMEEACNRLKQAGASMKLAYDAVQKAATCEVRDEEKLRLTVDLCSAVGVLNHKVNDTFVTAHLFFKRGPERQQEEEPLPIPINKDKSQSVSTH